MNHEEAVRRFLEEECYTTPRERDPRKPLLLEGEFVQLNPDFDPELAVREEIEQEIERREKHCGTSFFLNFDPLCNLHQLRGSLGESVREEIKVSLRQRFIEVFCAQFPDNPPPVGQLEEVLQVALYPWPQPGFNNGEVYCWLPDILLKEEFVFTMLKDLKDSIEENPVKLNIKGKDCKVRFYGWGFRYY